MALRTMTSQEQLASTANGDGASMVGVEDSAGNYTGVQLEAILAEIAVLLTLTTFQIDSGRNGTSSTTFGTPTAIAFNGTFDEPPIVIAIAEDGATSSRSLTVIKTTTTGFEVWSDHGGAFNWVAVTPGVHDVGGVIVQAGTAASDASNQGFLHTYQTGKTPSIAGCMYSSDDAAGSRSPFAIGSRMFGGETSANLNFAGRNSMIQAFFEGNTSHDAPCFMLISQTDPTQTGNAVTATGSQGSIAGKAYEAGTVVEVSSLTPSLTFETAFGAAPATLAIGETRDDDTASAGYPSCLNAAPTTGGLVMRMANTDPAIGYSWMAFETGFAAVTTAKRLG